MLQENTSIIKKVGTNGQISLGKEYAGKQIQISKLNKETLIIKSGNFIPNDEKWLHNEQNITTLRKAIYWAENNDRRDNFDQIKTDIENE
jgi:hypothetical protein